MRSNDVFPQPFGPTTTQRSAGSTITRAPMYVLLRMMNPPRASLEERDFAVINDGAYRFRLRTYYIRPEAQVAQLGKVGFESVRIWSRKSGTEIKDEGALREATDPWLYYLSTSSVARSAPADRPSASELPTS